MHPPRAGGGPEQRRQSGQSAHAAGSTACRDDKAWKRWARVILDG